MKPAFALVKPVVRGRVELPTFRFSGGRSYRLSYLTLLGPMIPARPRRRAASAVLTGFEPATSTLTGWRALQAALQDQASLADASRAPNGIRTRAAALKGRCPRPLDDGGSTVTAALPLAPAVGDCPSIGDEARYRQSAPGQPRRPGAGPAPGAGQPGHFTCATADDQELYAIAEQHSVTRILRTSRPQEHAGARSRPGPRRRRYSDDQPRSQPAASGWQQRGRSTVGFRTAPSSP